MFSRWLLLSGYGDVKFEVVLTMTTQLRVFGLFIAIFHKRILCFQGVPSNFHLLNLKLSFMGFPAAAQLSGKTPFNSEPRI